MPHFRYLGDLPHAGLGALQVAASRWICVARVWNLVSSPSWYTATLPLRLFSVKRGGRGSDYHATRDELLTFSLRSVFNGITTFPHWTGLHKEAPPVIVLPSDADLSDEEAASDDDEEEDIGRSRSVDAMGRPVVRRSGSGRRGEVSPLLKKTGE